MRKKKELVSIIMPAFNTERYIKDAIHSVLNQSYQQWELLIIDDASTDNTLNIIKEMQTKDSRIHVFHNTENLGASKTRNKGVDHSRGEWIAFLDSDDLWKAEKLEKQLNLAYEKTSEFIFTGSSFINRKGEPFKGIFEVPEKINYRKLRNKNVISCSSVLIRKRLMKKIRMKNDNMHEDYAVWLKVLQTGIIAHAVNEPLLIYRISFNSKSGNKIKAFQMTYRVFRYIGMAPIKSTFFTCISIIESIKKYYRIFIKQNIHK